MSDDDRPDDEDTGDAEPLEGPFERLDPGERGGDPFSTLGPGDAGVADEDSGTDPRSGDGDPTDTGVSAGRQESEAEASGAEPGTPGVPDDDPADLVDEGERTAGDSPFDAAEELFEEMEIDEIDRDTIWDRLTDARSEGSVADRIDNVVTEVSKHKFCEQCEHFSEPPDVACNHDGTQILEFVDMDTVRVRDCPVVEERSEIGTEE